MLPNFIVIGAAKAGTTALHWYLAEHPAVFMTAVKDPAYFAYGVGTDGRLLWGNPDLHIFPVKTLSEYERLFADAGNAAAIGEASTTYLECPQSAARIGQLLPAVRLLCSLRHPVDRAYSDYLMYLRARGRRLDPVRDLTTTAVWAQPESHWDARRQVLTKSYRDISTPFLGIRSASCCSMISDGIRRNSCGTRINSWMLIRRSSRTSPHRTWPVASPRA